MKAEPPEMTAFKRELLAEMERQYPSPTPTRVRGLIVGAGYYAEWCGACRENHRRVKRGEG